MKYHSHKVTAKLNSIKKYITKNRSISSRRKSNPSIFSNEINMALLIMNILNEGIILINENLEILYANRCALDVFDTNDPKVLKKTLFNIEEDGNLMNLFGSEFESISDKQLQELFHNNFIEKLSGFSNLLDSSLNGGS